jgi:nucleotide-binding universal stress UspA family protein
MRSALLGSVALHCVTHARCPVVVVRPEPMDALPETEAGQPRVLVGVDGSPGSRVALGAAVAEARRTGAMLLVVAAFAQHEPWLEPPAVMAANAEMVRKELQTELDDLVVEALAEGPADLVAPPVVTTVVQGPAGEVLVERSRTADLLVVGSRGRGTLRGLLLGSVALHCAMHASCPVMVVHPPR